MKTLSNTGPLFYAARTDKHQNVPKGKIHVDFVRYETLEIDEADFEKMTVHVHDANCREARLIAALVKL